MNAVRENPNVISGGNIAGFETDNPLLRRTNDYTPRNLDKRRNSKNSSNNTKDLVKIIKDLNA